MVGRHAIIDIKQRGGATQDHLIAHKAVENSQPQLFDFKIKPLFCCRQGIIIGKQRTNNRQQNGQHQNDDDDCPTLEYPGNTTVTQGYVIGGHLENLILIHT